LVLTFGRAASDGSRMGSIDMLWYSRDAAVWTAALRRYWDQVQPRNRALEDSLSRLDLARLRQMGPEAWYAFLRDEYFRWKYTAPNRYASTTRLLRLHVEEKGLDRLDAIRRHLLSVDPDDIEGALEVARRIPGLASAGASGLLSLMYPQHFGTVDQFVVKALRGVRGLPEEAQLRRMNPESLKPADGVTLTHLFRRKAATNTRDFGTEWTPRMIDQVLWGYRR